MKFNQLICLLILVVLGVSCTGNQELNEYQKDVIGQNIEKKEKTFLNHFSKIFPKNSSKSKATFTVDDKGTIDSVRLFLDDSVLNLTTSDYVFEKMSFGNFECIVPSFWKEVDTINSPIVYSAFKEADTNHLIYPNFNIQTLNKVDSEMEDILSKFKLHQIEDVYEDYEIRLEKVIKEDEKSLGYLIYDLYDFDNNRYTSFNFFIQESDMLVCVIGSIGNDKEDLNLHVYKNVFDQIASSIKRNSK